MKLRPETDLHIYHEANSRDSIPGVPLGLEDQLIEVRIDDYNTLKTLHIIDQWGADSALCGRSCFTHHEIHTLFCTTGHGDNKKPNSYLICNKCISALKEGEE